MDKLGKFFDEILNILLTAFEQPELRLSAVCVTLGVSFLFGCYIYFIYRLCNKTGFYSKNFNRTLAVMNLITAGMVLSMQTNAYISLGMVGALSIIRFRNVIKDPFDLLFLFWSISTGIICGTNQFRVALLLTVAVTVALLVFDRFPSVKAPMLLVVNSGEPAGEEAILALTKQLGKNVTVKSRSLSNVGLDLVIELRTNEESKLLTACAALPGVTSATLLSHDGELRG